MPFQHPRRTTKTTSSPVTPTPANASTRPTIITNMSLRKGATFHSPTSPVEQEFKVPSLPRRSQTTLEDVVDAHKRRVALTLGDIDRGLSAVEERSPSSRQSFRDEAEPVPRGLINSQGSSPATASYGAIMDGVMSKEAASIGRHSLRPRHNRRPSKYSSDSGLGSSIGSRSGKQDVDTSPTTVIDERKSGTASAITRSAAAHTSAINRLPRLSVRASNRINEHILKPLLAKSSLKDFQPIVKDCPRRVHCKEIVCLRDLEKTLIFMAPVSDSDADDGGVAHWFSRLKERTKTAALYLDFCLTSIRCIQATVEFLSERELTRPHDRPYTNGYFVDLVDQIKQYAQQVKAAKEKEAKGEKLDEMDPESSDEVKLHGGLMKNGRPAELVRVKKNGKAISIATGNPIDLEEDLKSPVVKRSMSEEAEDEESIMRSMARRKRSASAAELAPKRCREFGCDKEFKRPCDLTKHEKTHSRPWKCPVEACKYHEYGWPTEKEMDRHNNDKHSDAPAFYECHFKPCPYRSKRESNCKQHMEKAHGWEYVRSKNNGKNREKMPTSLPTPQSTNIPTPGSDEHNVHTPDEDDHDMAGYDVHSYQNLNQINFPECNANPEIDMFLSHQLQLEYSPVSDMTNSTTSSSNHSPYNTNIMAGQDQFQDTYRQDFSSNGADFSLFENEDLYSANAHLPTPSHEVFQCALSQFERAPRQFCSEGMPHISPVGHGNTMLYTPSSLREVDEGFEDFVPSNCQVRGVSDFQLYPRTAGVISSHVPTALFGEIPPPNFPGVSAQELLDFYAASTNIAMNQAPIDWSSDDQYSGLRARR